MITLTWPPESLAIVLADDGASIDPQNVREGPYGVALCRGIGTRASCDEHH